MSNCCAKLTRAPRIAPERGLARAMLNVIRNVKERSELDLMKRNAAKALPGMAEGQLWNIDDTCLQIVALVKNQAQFRILLAPGQTEVLSRCIRLDALAVYLRASGATLMDPAMVCVQN